MPSRPKIQAELWARQVRHAKWRYLVRNFAFRLDLNRVRHEVVTNLEHARNILAEGPFPADILSNDVGDLSGATLSLYESLYNETSEYGDPEDLWRLIRPVDAPPIPPLDLGKRVRLDAVDFYCRVYDMRVAGMRPQEIAEKLSTPLPTIKSALQRAEALIEIGPPEPEFHPSSHKANCPVCQRGEHCVEFEARDRKWWRELQADVDDEDAWQFVRLGLDLTKFSGEERVGRRLGHRGSADAQADRHSTQNWPITI